MVAGEGLEPPILFLLGIYLYLFSKITLKVLFQGRVKIIVKVDLINPPLYVI